MITAEDGILRQRRQVISLPPDKVTVVVCAASESLNAQITIRSKPLTETYQSSIGRCKLLLRLFLCNPSSDASVPLSQTVNI
jgi:hypothetical protein